MSKLCDGVIASLKDAFPQIKVKTEEFVEYKGQKLFLDIWVPQLDLVIEVHGRQHDQFVPHFHKSIHNFKEAKRRDRVKEEWAHLNNLTMVILRENQLPISKENLLALIEEAQNND